MAESRIVVSEPVAKSQSDVVARAQRSVSSPAAWIFLGVGAAFFLGTLMDLGTLWLAQRQEGLQWEYVAVTRTVEAFPRLILAMGFLYLAAYLKGTRSTAVLRTLAVVVLLLAVVAGGLAALVGTNYLSLVRGVNPEAMVMFKSTALKSGVLSVLYALVLLPAGISGLRRAR